MRKIICSQRKEVIELKYIMLVAGKGSRLHPITLAHPKSLFMLDDNTTVIERMASQIHRFDKQAEIIAVTGFMYKAVAEKVKRYASSVIYNPFYAVTNSLGSLWFARDLLNGDCVLINGDIVMEDNLVCDYVCHKYQHPTVLLDSSIKKDGDYNVQVANGSVVVMSKGLDEYEGEYAGVLMLPEDCLGQYKEEMRNMIEQGRYDQWYEDVMVNMIFKDNLKLAYEDINGMAWTEIDCVSDLVVARNIHSHC